MPKLKKLQRPATFTRRAIKVLSHDYFFAGIMVFFFLQMAWIALSAIYPMLFDEEYHLGIIEIYSRQISPFITTQPPEAAFHGEITRYGSYFFHYLMSFPYRLISLFTHDLHAQVVALRFICIGLVLAGLWLFRKVLLGGGLSKAKTHVVLLVFTLIPIVPFALAQLNYDALVFLLVPLLFYLAQKTVVKTPRQAWRLGLLLSVGLLAAIVKFTTLPIFVGALLFVGFYLAKQHRGKLPHQLWRGYKTMPRWRVMVLTLVLLGSLGLFVERYGANLATYRTLEPKCDRLHTREECLNYTVFRRDSALRAKYSQSPYPLMNPLEYSVLYWLPHIFGDFFVVAAFIHDDPATIEIRELPVAIHGSAGNIILRVAGWGVLAAFITLVAFRFRRLLKLPLFQLFFVSTFVYATALWIKNYTDYLSIGTPVAAQGRYFIPLLIPLIAIFVLLVNSLLQSSRLKLALVLLSLLLLTQGGGVASYILYSNQNWYWHDNRQAISTVNAVARKALRLFVPF